LGETSEFRLRAGPGAMAGHRARHLKPPAGPAGSAHRSPPKPATPPGWTAASVDLGSASKSSPSDHEGRYFSVLTPVRWVRSER